MRPALRQLALGLSLGFCASACATTSGAEARSLVAAGALLLDVRTAEEFAEGHLPGALNVPVNELEARLAELEPKSRPIVVYCRSGLRSARARSVLLANGWARVENLGPKTAWGPE
jgi:phage shock protein E